MGKPCNKCGATIGWKESNGKWIPLNEDGSEHKNTCTGSQSQSTEQRVLDTKVVWEKLDEKSEDQLQLVAGLREVRSLAYEFTKENHPELSENTNLFGTIVNANITHLIGLAQIKATKESS